MSLNNGLKIRLKTTRKRQQPYLCNLSAVTVGEGALTGLGGGGI